MLKPEILQRWRKLYSLIKNMGSTGSTIEQCDFPDL